MRGVPVGVIAIGALVAMFAAPARATVTEDYTNFSSTAGLSLVGSATTAATGDGTVLQLTNAGNQSGAAYSTTAVTLGTNSTFSTTFQFRIANPGGIDPADGFTFVLANGTTGLGGSGQGLGYQSVGSSVAVEFDTYDNNGTDGNSSNHVAIDINGNINNGTALSDQALTNVYGNGSCGFAAPTGNPVQNPYTANGCMSNGHLWTASIGYNGNLLSVALTDPSESGSFTAIANYAINIGSYLGTNTAYVGFTAGTAAGYEDHNIVNWQFANDTSLAPSVPEPGSLSLLGAGLVGLGLVLRRRRRAA